ncbi:MAG: tryptophan 7-halogenase [Lautropia sp.]
MTQDPGSPTDAEALPDTADVAIVGGGLAGLTLALQLARTLQRQPAPGGGTLAPPSIVVLERNRHPVPIAAHKVGESTVEIGADYLANVVGERRHLVDDQVKKFGFRFFWSDGRGEIERVLELGASRHLPTGSFQIDRGLFENHLGDAARECGVRFLDDCTVRTIDLSDGDTPHRLAFAHRGVHRTLHARWLVDASGRAGLLRRKLALSRPNQHDAGSVWFRVSRRIDIDRWSDDATWIGRCSPPERWRSTNHLVGDGYWVWLIPLASGSHSVGIVADNRIHPIAALDIFDKAMDWLSVHQPRLHAELDTMRDAVQDFARFNRFSYDCAAVYNGNQRWALTGEAGLFLDPFYSPGTDYIAFGNTFVTDLVRADREGKPTGQLAAIYQSIFLKLAHNQMSLYQDQYALFGNPVVMPVKVLWDYAYYWGIVCQLWFQRRLTDVRTMSRLAPELDAIGELNLRIQAMLRDWDTRTRGSDTARADAGGMLDQAALDWFAELNRRLGDRLDDAAFDAMIREHAELLHRLAGQIAARAGHDGSGIRQDPQTPPDDPLLFEQPRVAA